MKLILQTLLIAIEKCLISSVRKGFPDLRDGSGFDEVVEYDVRKGIGVPIFLGKRGAGSAALILIERDMRIDSFQFQQRHQNLYQATANAIRHQQRTNVPREGMSEQASTRLHDGWPAAN